MESTFGGLRAVGWSAGVAGAAAGTLSLLYAVLMRATGRDVLLLGQTWDASVDAAVVVAAVVALGALTLGAVVMRRLRPPERPSWQWYLVAAALVIPAGAVLEVVVAAVAGLTGLTAPA